MIITENILSDIVSQMPEIRINADICRKPNFHWGDRHELTKYLELKAETAYPLIWLMLGIEKHQENSNFCLREIDVIIATRETDKSLLNTQRYLKSFETVLNPVLNLFVEALESSKSTRIIGNTWMVERRPDYTESYYKGDNDNFTIDLWDAIRLTCEIEFNKNCLNTIKWKTK